MKKEVVDWTGVTWHFDFPIGKKDRPIRHQSDSHATI